MKTKFTYPTLDVVSAVMAATEHRTKLAMALNPAINVDAYKPSGQIHVPIKGEDRSVTLPSVTCYVKATLGGFDTKWLDEGSEAVEVTDAHRAAAETAMAAVTNKVMLMVLRGVEINDFFSNLNKLVGKEEVSGRDFGLLSFVPKTAAQFEQDAVADDIKASFSESKPLGIDGAKIELDVTIFDIRQNHEHNSIRYDCHDGNGNFVTFYKNMATKGHFEVDKTYRIAGRIKKTGQTPFSYGAMATSLYYVRRPK